MRAPPPPRRSKWSFIINIKLKLKRFYTCHKLRKRWDIHQIKRTQYRKFMNDSPISAVRVEDMLNLPSGLIPRSIRKKPLVIASFPRGCKNPPRINVLQRNEKSRIFLSRRKYKLKNLDTHMNDKMFESLRGNNEPYSCAQTVRSIKKMTRSHADVKTIFHHKNIIKCTSLFTDDLQTPQIMKFDNERSIRLTEYGLLTRKKNILLNDTSEGQNDNKRLKKKQLRITFFKDNPNLISFSSFKKLDHA
ncbi:Osw1p NDAI_0K01210 [Naumovozyma dairenensis CBS 421]|uniref:Uncharacterized protein n=1 Tax=Naumovozyma dairenensis (strain ATCC 10597 / BCRC 20456 / CBS 421 / NBRC 0211 / NRRL Y-12639) TaxID=1071378 RepID=G0WHQ1_NAUDC|nr:hypothetical protein NDAI_0K01210 [Naumovozyma dairenensis CBS 421]CCD27312.1 hypothetical protein NDAI_0K01210 [Naumovozyma dairenensis CBS 421]